MTPQVSVIIATYNRAELLRGALESVCAQTYRSFEVVVVDDGSTDRTREVVEAFRGRLPAVRYQWQPNRGQAGAWNTGVHLARGAYVALLDDDDVWMPERLAKQVPILERDPAVGLVYGRVACRKGDRILRIQPEAPGFTLLEVVERVCFIHSSVALVRRACFDRVGFFDETMRRVKDVDLWLRVAREYTLGFVEEVLATYGRHETNMTRDHLGGALGHLRAVQHVRPLPEAGVTWRLLRRRRAELHYVVARLAWEEARDGLAAKHFALALWEWPTIGARVRGVRASRGARLLGFGKPLAGVVASVARAMGRRLRGAGRPGPVGRSDGRATIVVLLHRSEEGGAAQSLREALAKMPRDRYRFVIVSPELGRMEEHFRTLGVTVVQLPAIGAPRAACWWVWLLAAWRLRGVLHRMDAQLLEVNYHSVATVGVLAARWAGVPAVVHVRVLPWLTWAEQWALSRAQRVVCVSSAVRRVIVRPRRISRWWSIEPVRCVVIPAGRDLEPFQQVSPNGVREELQIGSDAPLIGIAGSLEPNKRQDFFLHIAAAVLREAPRTRFLVVGEPNLPKHQWFRTHLLALRDRLGVNGEVMFTGWRRDMPRVLRALDVCVLLSRRDACPGVLIEAMAAGIPIVTSPGAGGAAEVVGGEGAGMVVESEDPRVYARVIVELLGDPERRRTMAEAGRRRAVAFNVAEMVRRMEQVYAEFAAAGGCRGPS